MPSLPRPARGALAAIVIALMAFAAPPLVAQTAAPSARVAAADAFGFEARGEVQGEAQLIGPTPTVRVVEPPAQDPQTASSLSEGDAELGSVGVTEVTADADLASGTAQGDAEVADVALLPDATDMPLVSADAIQTSARAVCPGPYPGGTLASVYDGSTTADPDDGTVFANLTIAGTAIPASPEPNTMIEIPNPDPTATAPLATIALLEVVPDSTGLGYTVRGMRVTEFALDGSVASETIVAESHASVDCAGEENLPPEAMDSDITPITVAKTSEQTEVVAGGTVTYDVAITSNDAEATCTLTQVIDRLPTGTSFTSAGGDFTDYTATVETATVRLAPPNGGAVIPAAGINGTITLQVAADAPAMIANDAEARTTCGTGRSGLTDGVTVTQPTPTPAPTETATSAPTASPSASPEPSSTPSGNNVRRLASDDRIGTSIIVSRDAFPDGADVAIIARADIFPDSLASGPFAIEIDGPILLTPSDELVPEVVDELARLGVTKVYLAGGTAALDESVENAVDTEGYELQRFAGVDRFDTAGLIAEEIAAEGGKVQSAIVARAEMFPDALAAINVGGYGRAPILLTGTDTLDPRTAEALGNVMAGDRVYLAGGTEAVGVVPEQQLRIEGYMPERLAGMDRYGTSVAVVEEARTLGADVQPVYLADGTDWADALIAGPAAVRAGGVLLLIDPRDLDDSPQTRDFLVANADQIDDAVIVGGPDRVLPEVEQDVRSAIAD